jgi:hypothetical protein
VHGKAHLGLANDPAGKDRAQDPFVLEVLVEPELPLACRAAIRAQVPVPQGERSSTALHDSGRSQFNRPVETTTAFLAVASSRLGGPVVERWSRTRPGPPQACVSTAVSILANRMTQSLRDLPRLVRSLAFSNPLMDSKRYVNP